jgi:hypothetical protein
MADRARIEAVVVIGSVARGDFNRWSDLDVLVVADELPAGAAARLELLTKDAPPGLQPVGWTNEEWAERVRRRDPMTEEAYRDGVVVWGRLPGGGVDRRRNGSVLADLLSLVDAIPFAAMHERSGRERPEPPTWAQLTGSDARS